MNTNMCDEAIREYWKKVLSSPQELPRENFNLLTMPRGSILKLEAGKWGASLCRSLKTAKEIARGLGCTVELMWTLPDGDFTLFVITPNSDLLGMLETHKLYPDSGVIASINEE